MNRGGTLPDAAERVLDDVGHIVVVPFQGDLRAPLVVRPLPESVASEEVPIPVHEASIAHLDRVDVVVLDPIRDEASALAEGSDRLEEVVVQPLAVWAAVRGPRRSPAAASASIPDSCAVVEYARAPTLRQAMLLAESLELGAYRLLVVPRARRSRTREYRPFRGAGRARSCRRCGIRRFRRTSRRAGCPPVVASVTRSSACGPWIWMRNTSRGA